MIPASVKKSFADLNRRRSRTIFTVVTIALAVSGLGLFAVLPLLEEAIDDRIEESNLYDLKLEMDNVNLTAADLQHLSEIDNVNAVEAKSLYYTRIYVGERRNDAIIIGVEDFIDQEVEIVTKISGNTPVGLQLMTDKGNIKSGLYDESGSVRLYDHNGQVLDVEVTGVARCLYYTDYSVWGTAVFYAPISTVNALANTSGYNLIDMDLEDTSREEADKVIAAVEGYLVANTDFEAYSELPSLRPAGSYPMQETFEDIMAFFYVMTLLTVGCSIFLISNTMHTMITEQRKEIAQLKAIGATRVQVVGSYMLTNVILGGTGSIIGVGLGTIIAYLVGLFLFDSFFGFSLAFAVYPPVIGISIIVGVAVTLIAAIPAMFFALQTSVRKGMEGSGMNSDGTILIFDKITSKATFIPTSSQMGMRNITRKKGRSISTILQVALAVGMFLGMVAIGFTVPAGIQDIFEDFGSEIVMTGQMTGANPLTEDLQFELEIIEGVAQVEPFVSSFGVIDEYEFSLDGLVQQPFIHRFERTLEKGRWITQDEYDQASMVIVLHRALASKIGKGIGDTVDITMATGVHTFEIIGLDNSNGDWGMSGRVPMTTLQELMFLDNVVTGFGIVTDTGERSQIDRVSTAIEDHMLAKGYIVNNYIMYMDYDASLQINMNIISVMLAVGTLIVLVTLIGLMSTLTMNVIERTKEIGMMRCIGSSSWSIRAVFGVEGLTLAFLGWVFGIPFGHLVAVFLNRMTLEIMSIDFPLVYPWWLFPLAGVVTLGLTLFVIQPPLWRAVNFKPGDALRYQ